MHSQTYGIKLKAAGVLTVTPYVNLAMQKG
jgi:hypothetical protein